MLPEIRSHHTPHAAVRLPQGQDVPLTPRVRRLVDSAAMRRLASISQLGLVSLVYPGATHSRLEHSLGVYGQAVRWLQRFGEDDRLGDPAVGEAFLLAALLHDVGHWPFCHAIEDMRIGGLGEHEDRIAATLATPELAECLDRDWQCDAAMITSLLVKPDAAAGQADAFARAFFASCLSGPIDVDKLDYLQRDSLHAGVPYGRNFDADRLIGSLCVHPITGSLAIHEKGRTAAEMMVFARYVMFSEVYWHHTVRSATAMLQRGVFLLQHRIDLDVACGLTDHDWIAALRRAGQGSDAEPLIEGLFGPRRLLHKRLAEFDVVDGWDIHGRLAQRPYWYLVRCGERLAERLSRRSGLPVHATDVLIDAPPVKLEVDINVDVIRRDGQIRSLGELSPVASALARQQFDHHVKRVRVFVRGDLRDALQSRLGPEESWSDLILEVLADLEAETT